MNYGFYSRWVLAREKALYRGHAVAAVAAVSAPIAEEAISLIDVEYEVLRPALDAYEAMKDDAPILHDRLLTMAKSQIPAGWIRRQPRRDPEQHCQPHRVPGRRHSQGIPGGGRGGGAGVSTPSRCTRDTSSRTRPLRCGTPTTASLYGAAPRGTLA